MAALIVQLALSAPLRALSYVHLVQQEDIQQVVHQHAQLVALDLMHLLVQVLVSHAL